jgi:hypothetical protein
MGATFGNHGTGGARIDNCLPDLFTVPRRPALAPSIFPERPKEVFQEARQGKATAKDPCLGVFPHRGCKKGLDFVSECLAKHVGCQSPPPCVSALCHAQLQTCTWNGNKSSWSPEAIGACLSRVGAYLRKIGLQIIVKKKRGLLQWSLLTWSNYDSFSEIDHQGFARIPPFFWGGNGSYNQWGAQ